MRDLVDCGVRPATLVSRRPQPRRLLGLSDGVEAYAAAKRGAALRAGGPGATGTNKTLSTLEGIMRTAVRHRKITRNPVDGYRVPGAKYTAAGLETAAQMAALLGAASDGDRARRGREGHGRALLVLLLYAGLRIDEALSLRSSDVFLATGTLRVRGGKTENAKRTVDLLPPLRDELAALTARRLPTVTASCSRPARAARTARPTCAAGCSRRP
jgi:integrase